MSIVHVGDLEDELEDLTLAQLIEDRLETPRSERLSLEDLAESLDRRHLLTDGA